jgi:hypothetical protein
MHTQPPYVIRNEASLARKYCGNAMNKNSQPFIQQTYNMFQYIPYQHQTQELPMTRVLQ